MKFFEDDVADLALPEYTFIEPNYDTGNNYQGGNSMHPLNDIRRGELLIKQVYETLRKSQYWSETMLIITFDEHGGFYDHVAPASTVATGDDDQYANPAHPFAFDQLGIRVPALVISAYTEKGSVIGSEAGDSNTVFDHSSVLATVEKRFQIAPLTERDRVAQTLDVAVNLAAARDSDAPMVLPDPAPDTAVAGIARLVQPRDAEESGEAPLSENQASLVSLALACDLAASPASDHYESRDRHLEIRKQKDAAEYVLGVESKIHSRRHTQL
jgi:phospholipase C